MKVGSSLAYDREFKWLRDDQEMAVVNPEYFSPIESPIIDDGQTIIGGNEGDESENNRRCLAIESTSFNLHINSTDNIHLNSFSCYLELDYYCEYS